MQHKSIIQRKIFLFAVAMALLALGVFLLVGQFGRQRMSDDWCWAEPRRQEIDLPLDIIGIGQIHYSHKYSLLLMAAEEKNIWSVWSFRAGQFERLMSADKTEGSQAHIYLDGQDNFYFEVNGQYAFYRSDNGGRSWQAISHGEKDLLWSITDGGQGVLYAGAWLVNKPLLYRSLDQGLTWETWVDFAKIFPSEIRRESSDYPFNRLRHLHDIVVYGDKILVGTGDIVRWTLLSEDKGQSWREVWYEGFTAHIAGPESGQIILGGDRADRHVLAFYDFNKDDQAENIWDQSSVGWSSYIYSMLKKDGRYYAGVHNENNNGLKYGVLKSCNGRDWRPWLEWQHQIGEPDTRVYLADSEVPGFFLSLNGALYLVGER